jgi:hypothetical protein
MEPTLIIGLVLTGIAGLTHFLSKRASKRAVLMLTTETKLLGEVRSLVDEIRADLDGDGESGYSEHCELKGKLVSDEPVRGELSGQDVAIYEAKVVRVIETRRERRDDEGHVTVSWVKSNETLSSNRREASFYLEDDSGRVRVLPAGAEIQLDPIVERFEAPSAVEQLGGSQLSLGIGSFSMSLSGGVHGDQRRTLGYRFEERILPLNRDVYVLGEVADTSDGLVLRAGSTKDDPFVISLKTEAELVRSKEASAKWLRLGAIVSLIGGIALVVMGLLK